MTIVSTILGIESGGKNIPQGNIGDINNIQGTPAQGYFQITDPTWAQFGGNATGFSSAIQAPYETQLAIAQNIPIGRWGPNTQSALASQGYSYSSNQTLGQVMANYGEASSTPTAPATAGSSWDAPSLWSSGTPSYNGSDTASSIPGTINNSSGYAFDTAPQNMSIASDLGVNSIGEPSLGSPSYDPSLGGITGGVDPTTGASLFAAPSIAQDLGMASGVGSLGVTPANVVTAASASSVPAAINAQTQGNAADTSAANQTAAQIASGQQTATTGWIANVESYLTDWVGRGVIIVLGMIFIGMGLLMFLKITPAEAARTGAEVL
jgi:hypothetical protein